MKKSRCLSNGILLLIMAEWERFELSRGLPPPNDLANRPLQPLEYHSVKSADLHIIHHQQKNVKEILNAIFCKVFSLSPLVFSIC